MSDSRPLKALDIAVAWSDEDGEYVATCQQFPSLSFLAPTETEARTGMVQLLAETIIDLENDKA